MNRKPLIIKLFNQQGGCCAWCGKDMVLRGDRDRMATVDHVIPKRAGGANRLFNMVAACYPCNNQKADMPLAVFLDKLWEQGRLHDIPNNNGFNQTEKTQTPRAYGIHPLQRVR